MDISAITKLPPKKLAMIVGGGVGAGLLWRHYASRKAASGGVNAAGTVDTSKLALAENSAGNLAAAQSQQVPSTNDAIRDVGQGFIPIPVSKWVVIGADGVSYYADANGIIGPVNTSNPAIPGGPVAVNVPSHPDTVTPGVVPVSHAAPTGSVIEWTNPDSQWGGYKITYPDGTFAIVPGSRSRNPNPGVVV